MHLLQDKRDDRHLGHKMQVRVPEEMWERIQQASSEHGLPANWFINKALEVFFRDLLSAQEMRWTR
jgi:predicted DNA binding CopG/RHH family protein